MPPGDLLRTLQQFRRRVRLLGLAYGVGLVLAAAVGLLLATILLDYLLDLHPIPRLIVMLAAVGGVGWVLARYLVRPSLARLNIGDMAGRIETNFPVFDDRLRSTVDFLNPEKSTAGSEAMKQRVIQQATELASKVPMARVINTRPAVSSLGGGVGAVIFCIALSFLVSPVYVHAALARLLDPFHAPAWPKSTQIQMLGKIPSRVPSGEQIDLLMRLIKGDKPSARGYVDYCYDGGVVEHEIMTRNGDGTYSANLDARNEPGRDSGDMQIWVRAGDDQVTLPLVQIVEPLSIRRVEAVVQPPPYVMDKSVAPLTLDLSSAAGDVTIGSPIALSVTFNKPLAPGSTVTLEPLVDNETVPPIDWDTNAAAGSAVGHWVARQSLHFRVRAIDGDGFANSAIEEYQILVHPDRPPSVQFEKPTENEDVTPQAIIPLQAMAEDDYGIKTMQLVIRRLSDQKQWTQDLITNGQPVSSAVGWQLVDATADLRRFRMNWSWELDKLDAAPPKVGDQFEYYLRVQDSFVDYNGKPHNPPFSESGHLRLTIISQESLVSEIMDRLSELRTETNTVRQKNEEVRIATKNVIDDTHGQKSLDKADKMLVAQLNNDQSSAASQTEQISSKLDDLLSRLSENRSPDTDLSGNISQAKVLLNDVAGNLMKEAMTRLSDLHDYDHPADARNTEFDQTQSFQSQASDELHQAMDKMGSDTGVAQFIKRVDDLLNAQRAISAQTANAGRSMLGKDPTQLTPNEQKTLGALSQQQQDLQHQVDAAMKDMSNAADKQARTDPDSAAALRQAVTTGQTQDVSGNMGQAAQAVSSNQQSQAQSSQQQAELGLLMILRQLQEADNRRLASLIKQLEDAQQLLADLIQQQSSHNLDNLAIQGPPAVKAAAAADPELIEDLNNYAGRDPKNPPAVPTLNTLITLQAQTEHNTRNVIPVIEALPEGAEPAAHLTRAAQEMSRAVVHLMDSQLVDAYQPPQVEALEALLQAKDNVDAQHDKALQQLGQQQKESIRQEFIKIRDEQVKIDRMTKTAGAAPKAPDGSIAHEAKALLGILSIQQGKLADRASKLDQDLISLGSIAYTYANDDIVSQMNGVKDHLNAFEAGLPTQKSQARIVAELDDMIKELAIKPKISDFAQGGGGGGGQCAPHLPTEAEIRLIRDLQKGVNDDTKDADAQSPHDKQAILELGKREGDLRQLLDHILQKASGGQLKLGSEPSNKDTLPEEASNEDLDLEELRDQALNAKPDAQGESDDTGLVGLRMARAHQRLALNLDPGQTTQRIQARILLNLDALAEMARQEEATGRPRQGQPGQPQQANPNQGRPVNPNNTGQGMASRGPKSGQGGTTPAGDSTNGGPGLTDEDINASIQQLKNNWGAISPRQRAAIMESASERTLTQFKTFVDGYYRTLADKATQQ